MKHIRFDENILIDESYTGGRDGDSKKGKGIAKHFAESLEEDDHNTKWYHQVASDVGVSEALGAEAASALRSEAVAALQQSTREYEAKMSTKAGSELAWARTLLHRGAIADRVAAATLLVQDSPVNSESVLRALIGNVKPAKKKDALVSIDALSELFVSCLLPPGVKLRRWEQQPLSRLAQLSSGDRRSRGQILALWLFEDTLKGLYAEYVELLNTLAHDSVEANRARAVSAIAYLLTHHPENEKVLLQHLVNKLGDPAQAVASKVVYHLCQLVYNHPNMKSVLLTQLERVLFRSNISSRAQYYGLCFLTQIHLDKDDDVVAENLIRVYFAFFNANIKKGEIDSRMMGALLTGVKRAYPFANRDRVASDSNKHIQAVQKLVHVASFNTAVHALALLYNLCEPETSLADRYYNALYRKLGCPELLQAGSTALLLHLVYKSLRQDTDLHRIAACLKRCLQLAAYATPAHSAALLLLVSQVAKDSKKRDALRLILPKHEIKEEEETREESIEDDSEEQAGQQEKQQTEKEQTEKKKVKEEKKAALDLLHGDKLDLLQEESDEEYWDVKEEAEESGGDTAAVAARARKEGEGRRRGWHHVGLQSADIQQEKHTDIQLRRAINTHRQSTRYEPCARNPSHAGAELVAATELVCLARHVHPSVKLFATNLLNGQVIHYTGDPLKDFSCVNFLERFAFKNPKKRESEAREAENGLKTIRGSHPKFAQRKNYVPKGVRGVRVTSAAYLNESVANIPPDELFLYNYLRKRRAAAEKQEEEEESDAESVASDEFHSYLDQLTGTRARDESDEELDWSSAVQGSATPTNKQQQRDDEWSEDEDDEQLSDTQQDSSDEDEEEEQLFRTKRNKGKSNETASVFASAEEFAELLEESGKEPGAGTSRAADTRDHASRKQLAWERGRDARASAGKRPRQHTALHHKRHKRN